LQPEGWKAGDFKADTGYSIMFGPDKCGATNKVHFIFRHKSPKTGEYVEHHLEKAPIPKAEWVAHVYTAVINAANNSVKILIDDEEAAFGDLLSYQDFQPPVLPPKTIKDPEDKKPEDWWVPTAWPNSGCMRCTVQFLPRGWPSSVVMHCNHTAGTQENSGTTKH